MQQNYSDLHDIAAESATVATIIYHPDFILHSDFLKANMFSQPENGSIYWAIQELYKSGIDNIDEINLNNQLQKNAKVKSLMAAKGIDDIRNIVDMSRYAARDSLPEYLELCKTVCNYAYKREIYKFSDELKRRSLDDKTSITQLDYDVHQRFSDMTQKFIIQEDLQSVGKTIKESIEKIKDRQGKTELNAIPTMLKCLRPYISYKKTRLIVIAGRQKAGKSLLAMNSAISAASNGIPTLYIDSEISDEDFSNRMLANLSGITFRRIDLANDLSVEEINNLEVAGEKAEQMPLYHYSMPVVDMDKVYSLCKTLQYKAGIQFVVYDYIKAHKEDMGGLSNELGRITDRLKAMATELDLPVLAACQLGRGNGKDKDVSERIFGSDQIGMFVNAVVMLAQKTPEEIQEDGGLEYGTAKVKVSINRDGGSTSDWLSVGFDGDHCRFYDCPQPQKRNPFDE